MRSGNTKRTKKVRSRQRKKNFLRPSSQKHHIKSCLLFEIFYLKDISSFIGLDSYGLQLDKRIKIMHRTDFWLGDDFKC